MDIRPIHTEADYQAALKAVPALMAADPDPGTPQGASSVGRAAVTPHAPSPRPWRRWPAG
jgi:antitoxin component HigA of HigAB toxin-antitoxin module